MKYLGGMFGKNFQFLILGGVIFLPSISWAQQQSATQTTYDKPDVEINRSVLQELKGYEPPPMFSKAEPSREAKPITTPAPDVIPLVMPVQNADSIPSLTAPRAEDLLGYPTQNFHVLTEQKGSMTLPLADSLPVSVAQKQTTKLVPKPIAKKKDKIATPHVVVKKEPAITTYVIPARLEDRDINSSQKKAKQLEKAKAAPLSNDFVMPKVPSKSYKLKSSKTMPAVPSIGVEKLALPPTLVEASPTVRPSIGDKIIDQTLNSRMEKDPSKITAALTGTIKEVGIMKEDAISASKQMSFEFKSGITDLSKDQILQLGQSIMPSLKKDTTLRIEIRSFAAVINGDESGARRVALSRALAMRQYFVDKGITPARMDLRALGNETDQTPQDRVDLQIK